MLVMAEGIDIGIPLLYFGKPRDLIDRLVFFDVGTGAVRLPALREALQGHA